MDEVNRTVHTDDDLVGQFFRQMMSIPSEWYFYAAIGSIAASAYLYLAGHRHTALFVGQWAPTFLVSALFTKLLHPAHENLGDRIHQAVGDMGRQLGAG
jgi:hypothetical protein